MAAHENLGGQFKRLNNDNSRLNDDNSSRYDYVKTSDELAGYEGARVTQSVDYSHLTMSVDHDPGTSAYATREPMGAKDFSGRQGTSLEDSDYRKAVKDLEADGPGGQMKLFGMYNRPGTSTVSYLMGTREGSRHAMTMLALAHNDTVKNYGRSLIPDSDLSPHSHKLAKHISDRTLNEDIAPRDDAPNNNMTFWSSPDPFYGTSNKNVPESEVSAARSLIKDVIRGKRTLDVPKRGKELPPPTGEPQTGPVNPNQFKLF
jgi:hypothetical protein